MAKVECPFEYCKWNKNSICSKPKIRIDTDGCKDFEPLGLDKMSIDKIVKHIKKGD